MNLKLLNLIKEDVLKIPYVKKESSNEFAGVYLHSGSPFKLSEHLGPIHSLRVFSEKEYPINFFISLDAWNEEFDQLLKTYTNIIPYTIPKLNNVIEFNNFSINTLPHLISQEKLLYIQFDGFLLKSGWEKQTEGFSWLGAKWKSPIQVIEHGGFGFPSVQIGNGGCNFRLRSKMIEILDLVASKGGQDKIVKGIVINNYMANQGSFLAEDLFFCYFGFGAGILKTMDLEEIDKFAIEPLTWKQYNSLEKPYLFHRIDK